MYLNSVFELMMMLPRLRFAISMVDFILCCDIGVACTLINFYTLYWIYIETIKFNKNYELAIQ